MAASVLLVRPYCSAHATYGLDGTLLGVTSAQLKPTRKSSISPLGATFPEPSVWIRSRLAILLRSLAELAVLTAVAPATGAEAAANVEASGLTQSFTVSSSLPLLVSWALARPKKL